LGDLRSWCGYGGVDGDSSPSVQRSHLMLPPCGLGEHANKPNQDHVALRVRIGSHPFADFQTTLNRCACRRRSARQLEKPALESWPRGGGFVGGKTGGRSQASVVQRPGSGSELLEGGANT